MLLLGLGLVCLLLSNLAGPLQHFKAAILDAWRNKVAADLCGGRVFEVGLCWMSMAPCSSLILLMFEKEKALLRSIMDGGVWNVFFLNRVKELPVPCRFCGSPDGDGHLFWERTFPPLVQVRENPEVHDLMRMDKAHWPRCLLWHGWLPLLIGVNGALLGRLMLLRVLVVWLRLLWVSILLGCLMSGVHLMSLMRFRLLLLCRITPMFRRMVALFLIVLLVSLRLVRFFFAHQSDHCWSTRSWGHVDGVRSDCNVCRGFFSVPGPLQSVQRAEMWGVILALQSSRAVHLGVDNLGLFVMLLHRMLYL